MVITATVLLSPAMLEDKTLRQGDIQNNVGMSKEARDIERRDGEIPKWTDSMFGGMPTTQITGTDIATAPKGIWKVIRSAMPIEVGTLIVAMLSAYVLGLCLGLSPWLSLLLGLGFGLSSVNVLYLVAGHATKVRAIATMPGVVAGVVLVFRNRMWAGAGVAAFFGALHLQADHLQMTYYLLFLLGAIVIAAWIRSALMGTMKSTLQGTGLLVLAGLLAAMPMTGQLSMTEQYSEYTTRGTANLSSSDEGEKKEGLDRDYMLQYSMSRGEFWSMAIPNVKGGHLSWLDVEGGEKTYQQLNRTALELGKSQDDVNRSGMYQFYWGAQSSSAGAFYFGAFAFALCLMWFLVGSSWLRWPLAFITIVAVVLSWKETSWMTDFFMDHVPLYTKFRDTKMMLVLVQIVIPLGAALALHELIRPEAHKQWKKWIIGGGAVLAMQLLLLAAPQFWFDFDSPWFEMFGDHPILNQVRELRVDAFRSDAIRSFGLTFLACAALLALLKKWLHPQWIVAASIAIVAIEMVSVNSRYVKDEGKNSDYVSTMDKRFPFTPSQADLRILEKEKGSILQADFDAEVLAAQNRWKDQLGVKALNQKAKYAAQFEVLNANTHFRVFDLSNPFNDARTSYFHKSVGGYHGAKLMRFQEFSGGLNIERAVASNVVESMIRQGGGQSRDPRYLGEFTSRKFPGLAMLNTKYVNFFLGQHPETKELVYIDIPFKGALGPAWFVNDIEWVDSPEEELNRVQRAVDENGLVEPSFDPATTAVVHREFESTLKDVSNPGRTTVKLDQYHPEGSTYSVNSDNGGLLVLSEMYYPSGWTAKIDGEETPLVRANYLLMALQVPPGEHTVQLHFEPEGWETARGLSIAGSVLWVLLLGACIWQDRRTRLASN